MDMLSLLLSGVVAAAPATPLPWFEMDDYPVYAFQRRQQGDTAFELLVDPSGKPTQCAIIRSSGSPSLDRQACTIARRRASFTPARDAQGAPAYGTYRGKVAWTLDPEKWAQLEFGPDVEYSVSSMPVGSGKPIDVKFAYMVGPDGRASSCQAIVAGHPAVLDQIGCDRLMTQAQRSPTARLVAAPVVQTTWVRFALQ